ncbi:hypothetical protein [Mucilaginibacter pedocola]|uniref:Uncharacterized protein n=1 Tax=Mucilaginibacter pedocola TaxID=1792845 RepID=A0A1S9PB47_9SPHI|nr:hypothetical protein [Mucilaginibacter pedocola]OOQ58175.1 hypothetical protein BC343_11030 [Mucilaginibacter pedocola]
MLRDRSTGKEEGYIADELFSDEQYELERQCMTVADVVQRKVLSLQEALTAYEVTEEQYFNFLAASYFTNITSTIQGDSEKLAQINALTIVDKLLKKLFAENGQHKDLTALYSSLGKITEDVKKNELKVSL